MADLLPIPNPYKFCPRCGTSLEMRPNGGRLRPTCAACGFTHFSTFSLGVGGLVVRAGGVLLVRRGQDPGKGRWTIPGGYAEQDEPFEEAVVREVYEETGIRTAVEGVVAVRNSLTKVDSNVYVVFKLRDLGGEITIDGEEIDRAGFYAPHEWDRVEGLAPISKYLAQMALHVPTPPLTLSRFNGQTSAYKYTLFDAAGFSPDHRD